MGQPRIIVMPDGTEIEVSPAATEETIAALESGETDILASPLEIKEIRRKPVVRWVRLEDNDALVIAQAFRWLSEDRGFVAPEESRILGILHDAFVVQQTMAVPKSKKKRRR